MFMRGSLGIKFWKLNMGLRVVVFGKGVVRY